MNALDYAGFRAEIKKGVSGGYLFCGEEAYLLRHSLGALAKSLFGGGDDPFNHVRLDAAAHGYDLADVISQLPVFAEQRLVELWGYDAGHAKKEDSDELFNALETLSDNPQTVFVLCESEYELDMTGYPKRRSKTFNKLAEYLTPVVFMHETPSALAKWASAHFAHEKVNADPAAIRALLARVGNDMYTLSGEISKLCAYSCARADRTVTPADVEAICALRPQIGDFEYSDAILSGNFEKAMFIVADARSKRTEPVAVISEILRSYARMRTILAMSGAGAATSEIAKILKMHEFPVTKHLNAAQRIGEKRIDRALELCGYADRKMKLSSIDGYVIITRLLAELAAL